MKIEMVKARWMNDHLAEGHVHRSSYAGDGCDVCDELFFAKIDERKALLDSLHNAYEERGDPLPKVVPVTVPLDCTVCGEIHIGEEYEAWYDRGEPGRCPGDLRGKAAAR